MKKFYFTLSIVLSLAASILFAQTETFNYQAVVRDGSGLILNNQNVTLNFSIRSGSASGTEEYAESHSTSTNAQGLVNVAIGAGSVTAGNFFDIAWSETQYFLNVKLNGTDLGTSAFKSVPYAASAREASTGRNDFTVDSTIIISNSGQVFALRTNPAGQIEFVPNDVSFGAAAMTIDDDGVQGVGIGTSNPTEKLEVNGAVKVSGTTSNPLPRTLYGNAIPLAYGFIYFDGALSGDFGVSSVTKTGTGRYSIVLENPSSGNVSFVANMWDTNALGFISYYQNSSTLITVRTTGVSGVDQNQGFSFIVFGNAQ